ncbi:LysR family transcriptional regulator [Paenalkalicoccus suaedae]|uniref:LysR family transcriptional regulator n=1 Tax=Paenalkalicoccus suaedae TaxID=2592382 RepID=A0A859FAG8_9BACI|nr:LysR family transcriptional regulator [Paenalkalicoccus suaedae]QKS70303.1 LysR family transcriptional regulator [Paenalkalicoccus suaedae]
MRVVEVGSYTRAAMELDYAQSSVTNHIQKLEKLYGGNALLERKGRYMKPTSSGELLFDYAKQMLSLYQESHLALQEQEVKSISIGTIETLAIYYLPKILAIFKEQYPNILIRIVPDSEKNIIRMIKEKEIDFGLILDSPYKSSGIKSLPIQKEAMMIVVPQHHILAKKTSIKVEDLEHQPLILTEEGCTYRARLLDQLKKQTMTYNVSMELSSVETIKKAVQNDWGIGFLPEFVIEKHEKLKGIHYMDEDLDFFSQLVYRTEKTNQNVFKSFITLCQSTSTQ